MKYLVLPIFKILLFVGMFLGVVEKILYTFLSIPLFIFTTIDIEQFVNNTSIIEYIAEHYYFPLLDKIGFKYEDIF